MNTNNRIITLGATLGAAALALGAPLAASAQDQPAQLAPGSGSPSGSYGMPSTGNSQADQLDRLQALGFIGSGSVLLAPVEPGLVSNFGTLPPDKLASTLDNVKVSAGAKGLVSTLRGYLDSKGITPDRIVSVMVGSNNVVIGYEEG